MTHKIAVLLADGFEEIEAVTVVDVLRRAELDVVVLGVDGPQPTGSHAIAVRADALLADRAQDAFDVVVLPGGMPGAARLRDAAHVQRFVVEQRARGASLAAICAAPIALGAAGVLKGKRATCFPGFEAQLGGATPSTDAVVVDGDVTTSRGVGTALAFALSLVAQLRGDDVAKTLGQRMLVGAA